MYAKPPSVKGAADRKSVLLITKLRSELYQSRTTVLGSHSGSSSTGGVDDADDSPFATAVASGLGDLIVKEGIKCFVQFLECVIVTVLWAS